MKAAPFSYHRPETRAEALSLLSSQESCRILAGGQSLVPMLNMRYALVEHVIDVNRVPDLAGIEISGSTVRIGAMTRQREIYEHEVLKQRAPVINAALRYVGHLQTRNRGTIGGSLAHMDPAAELVGISALLDATVHVESASGKRGIPMAEYPAGYMTPSFAPDEMVSAVSFDLPAQGHGWSFMEFAQRHGDFAIVGVGALLEVMPSNGLISSARIVLIGVGAGPLRLKDAEQLLQGQRPTQEAFKAAADLATRIEAIGDAMASADYRRRLAGVLTNRVLSEAAARAQGRIN